jgi:hypothetical protein
MKNHFQKEKPVFNKFQALHFNKLKMTVNNSAKPAKISYKQKLFVKFAENEILLLKIIMSGIMS